MGRGEQLATLKYTRQWLDKPHCQWCRNAGKVHLVQAGTGYTWNACEKHAKRALDLASRPIWVQCEQCDASMAGPGGPGRPARFCSPACRQAAWRAKQRT